MAQSGYTPILLYGSGTTGHTPSASNLTTGSSGIEVALNYVDGILFYKDNNGTVQQLATKAATAGNFTTVTATTSVVSPQIGAASGSALSLQSNGTTNATLDTSGNLGLGVTPSAWGSGYKAFQVGPQAAFVGYTSQTVVGNNWYDPGPGTPKYLTSNPASIYVSASGAHTWYIAPSGTAGNAISFTQAMTLNNSGYLGIGNTSPSYGLTLNVNGLNTTAGWYQNALLADASGNRGIFFGYDTSGNNVGVIGSNGNTGSVTSLQFWTYNGSTWGSRLMIDPYGNLGLGVTPSSWSPGKAIEIGYSGNAFWGYAQTQNFLTQNAHYNGSNWLYSSSNQATTYTQDAGTHQWWIAPSGTAGNAISFTQAMTLDNSGNLGIGQTPTTSISTTPGTTISSGGYQQIQRTAASTCLALNASGSGNTGTIVAFYQNQSSVGSISVSAIATAYNITSDERLKNDFGVVNSTDIIANTQIHDVTYKADETQTHMLSVMAQEAVNVNPIAVTVGSDEVDENGNLKNPWQVDYSKYVPALIVEVQSLRARVAQLEGK